MSEKSLKEIAKVFDVDFDEADIVDAFVRSYKRQNEFMRELHESFIRTCYIMAHRDEIHAEYAWTIGKAPEHLTEQDRKQAILDYVLEVNDDPRFYDTDTIILDNEPTTESP